MIELRTEGKYALAIRDVKIIVHQALATPGLSQEDILRKLEEIDERFDEFFDDSG